MPTLGTQTISSSFAQLIKTFSTGGLDGALQVITDGDNTSSALSLSTSGVSSTGSFTVSSNSSLLGPVTFGSSLTASTGTSTIGTLFASGPATFGTSFTASTGTATIGTLSVGTATISTATIPLQLGNVTFGSNITASTGTATIGTEIVSTSTIGTLNVSGLATVGSLEIGGLAGPIITKLSYGTAALGAVTLGTMTSASSASTGTFALAGVVAGDTVVGQTNIAFTGSYPASSFSVFASDVCRYIIFNPTTTISTITSGTISANALRTIA